MAVRDRVVANGSLWLRLGIGDHSPFRQLLHFFGADSRGLSRASLQSPKVEARPLDRLLPLKIAHQTGGGVVGGVVNSKKRNRPFPRHGPDNAGPANYGPR